MNITSIHFKILSCLLINNYSINELSEILSMSIFKIRRYTTDLGYLLKEESISAMHEKLKKNPQILDEMRSIQIFTAEERRSYLVLRFLESNIINLTTISEDISITRRTLANDIVNLKKELEIFNLKIVSYNSYGVFLEGLEKDKRRFFELYFIKMFIEKSYLPNEFQEFFIKLKKIKKEFQITEIINQIYQIYEECGILRHTYISLHIEVLSYLAIIRKNFEDKSLEEIEYTTLNYKTKNRENLNLLLNNIAIFSTYEKENIKDFCLKRNRKYFFETNKEQVLEIENFMKFLNKKLRMEIKLEEDLIIRLTTIITVMKFKKLFNITDIYFINNQVVEDYLIQFKTISNLIKKYYTNIDSFDNTILSIIFLNEVNKEIEKKIKKLNNIVVIYNFLSIGFIVDIFKEFGFEELLSNIKFISYRDIDDYIPINNVNGIIMFENIKLDQKYKKIKRVSFTLPLIKLDLFKLSYFIDENEDQR